jgi:hypothetical protein
MLVTFDVMKNESGLAAGWKEIDGGLNIQAIEQARQLRIEAADFALEVAAFCGFVSLLQ